MGDGVVHVALQTDEVDVAQNAPAPLPCFDVQGKGGGQLRFRVGEVHVDRGVPAAVDCEVAVGGRGPDVERRDVDLPALGGLRRRYGGANAPNVNSAQDTATIREENGFISYGLPGLYWTGIRVRETAAMSREATKGRRGHHECRLLLQSHGPAGYTLLTTRRLVPFLHSCEAEIAESERASAATMQGDKTMAKKPFKGVIKLDVRDSVPGLGTVHCRQRRRRVRRTS